ncbi:hypothetical protein [Nocardia sp. NBC_00416]|uniref:hypothetical protein n=1 Tax=Nocardia sp. NBC_00416 TaxID=2975991 RepID=UPI002E1C73AF
MRNEQDAVLDAVLELVASRGVTETTPRRVADRSGVDGKTLRRDYGSQYGLLMAAAKALELRRDRRLTAVTADREPVSVADRRAYLEDVSRALLEPVDHRELLVGTELVSGARLVHGMEAEAAGAGAQRRAIVAAALARVGVTELEIETERLVTLLSGLAFELVYPHGGGSDTADRVLRHHIATLVT